MIDQTDQTDQTDPEDINRQLVEAFEAREAVSALDDLRAKADMLPALLEAKEQEFARDRAEGGLERAIALAIPEFEQLQREVPALRQKMQDLIDEIPVLADKLRQKQNALFAAGAPLLAACEAYDRAFAGEKPHSGSMPGMPDNSLPIEMQRGGTRFDEALARAGATNPALTFTPAEGLPEWMRLLLRAHRTGIIYRPEQGSRNWRRTF